MNERYKSYIFLHFIAMKIQISQPTRVLLETFGTYKTQIRGEMEIKVN